MLNLLFGMFVMVNLLELLEFQFVCNFSVHCGFAVRLRCRGVDPDDHPVKKEFVSVCNTNFICVSQPSVMFSYLMIQLVFIPNESV